VFNSIGLQECTEFFSTELRSVVTHKDVWNALKAFKKAPEHLNGHAASGAVHDMHQATGMCIHT